MVDILQHERLWITRKLEIGIKENTEASDAMREAIENGNVWHDNAEYDEVIERMKRIDSTYAPFATLLANSVVVDYPDPLSNTATLGSLVQLENEHEIFDALLVGVTTISEAIYSNIWEKEARLEDLTIVGATSPMGNSIIGLKVGETAMWTVNDKELNAHIHNIDNNWLNSVLKELATY